MAIQVQVFAQFPATAGEAVHHDIAQPVAKGPEDREEVVVRITQVQEHRQPRIDPDLQLGFEDFSLNVARRKIPEIIQPGLAGRHDQLAGA